MELFPVPDGSLPHFYLIIEGVQIPFDFLDVNQVFIVSLLLVIWIAARATFTMFEVGFCFSILLWCRQVLATFLTGEFSGIGVSNLEISDRQSTIILIDKFFANRASLERLFDHIGCKHSFFLLLFPIAHRKRLSRLIFIITIDVIKLLYNDFLRACLCVVFFEKWSDGVNSGRIYICTTNSGRFFFNSLSHAVILRCVFTIRQKLLGHLYVWICHSRLISVFMNE